MDDQALKKKLPLRELLLLDGVTIGVCHGHLGGRDALTNAKLQFINDPVRVVIFGHSHQALNEIIDGVLYFNPGSPNDVIKARYFSCGMLTISNNKVSAEIIKL